jgi:hypothetical protein
MGKSATVGVRLSKHQLMQALRDMTIHDDDFDPDPWSIDDADDLERASALIRREILAKRAN